MGKRGPLLRQRPDLIVERIDGESIVLDAERDLYFGIEGSGALIWDLIGETGEEAEVVDALRKRFPHIERARLQADVHTFVRDALEAGLLITDPDPS